MGLGVLRAIYFLDPLSQQQISVVEKFIVRLFGCAEAVCVFIIVFFYFLCMFSFPRCFQRAEKSLLSESKLAPMNPAMLSVIIVLRLFNLELKLRFRLNYSVEFHDM